MIRPVKDPLELGVTDTTSPEVSLMMSTVPVASADPWVAVIVT